MVVLVHLGGKLGDPVRHADAVVVVSPRSAALDLSVLDDDLPDREDQEDEHDDVEVSHRSSTAS
jgi:hypothetical protein